jgi:hypothetical protein
MAKITTSHTQPFQGGIDEVHEKPNLIPVALLNDRIPVALSQVQNLRPRRTGFEEREGSGKHHSTTAHGSDDVISLYGFSKGKRSELALFAQYDDGSVDKATDNPTDAALPITTGNFGTSVLPARSSPAPASWANFIDYMLYADGAGQAQIYTGEQQKPILINVYKGTAMPDVPEEGADYTLEATDDDSTTVVELDSLDTLANNDALFIGFDTPVNKITLTVSAVNGNASVATLWYRKNDSTWADASDTDGTISGGASIGQTGSFTWTLPTDEVSHFAFGQSCFLYRITFLAALDSEVEISAITGENTAGFQSIQNVWDGKLPPAVEAIALDTSGTTYYNYAGNAFRMTDFTWVGGANDYLYVSSLDRIFGLQLDIGKTPNTTASSSVDEVATWTGSGWTAVTGLNDGTAGGANSGFVTWARNNNARKTKFKGFAPNYWYRIRFDTAVAGATIMTWGAYTMPYFNIDTDYYKNCQTVTTWDKRVWFSFNNNYIYGSATFRPMTLNGDDVPTIPTGDHRSNKILCTRRFYNHLLVWSEERGKEGGCFGVLQPGATAAGYAYQIISSTIGIMNSKCAVVLEDVNMEDFNKEVPIVTGAFFVSKQGVYKSNGNFVTNISGGIANYFDSSKSEYIRAGYEDKHFLEYDSRYGILRLGLVSGNSATKPNKFFLYDFSTGAWTEDILAQAISSLTEVEAASGDIGILQYAGCQDGYVRRVNVGNQDDGTDITSNVILSINGRGKKLILNALALRCKAQASGNITVTIAVDSNSSFGNSRTLTMTVYDTNDSYRAHRPKMNKVKANHIEIKLENSTSNVPMYLLDYGIEIEEVENNTIN